MWVERGTDARMRRTANRPAAGRAGCIQWKWSCFGTALAVTGVNYLYHALPTRPRRWSRRLTFVTYVAVYTPLKQVTPCEHAHRGDSRGTAAGHRLVRGDRDDRLGRRSPCSWSCSSGSCRTSWPSPGCTGTTTPGPVTG